MLAHRNFTCIEGCQPHAIIKRTHWECRSLKRYRSHKRNRMLLHMASAKIIAVIYSLLYVYVYVCVCVCVCVFCTKIHYDYNVTSLHCIMNILIVTRPEISFFDLFKKCFEVS